MAKIKDIRSREILDSRGLPTIETAVILDNGITGVASVPSGASTGRHEALELRDNDTKRYQGKGVLKAVFNTENKILPVIKGIEIKEQEMIDRKMIEADGTPNKSNFGANSILSVSLASARAASLSVGLPLYQYIKALSGRSDDYIFVTPMFNVINGGLHGSGNLSFQEFLLIPDKTKNYFQSLEMGAELYYQIKEYLKSHNFSYSVGDEGGFTPNLSENKEVLDLLRKVIDGSKYRFAQDIHLGLDLASSEFYKENQYEIAQNLFLRGSEFIDFLIKMQKEYMLFSLEDPLSQDDWEFWSILTAKIGHKTKIIGDDLLVTNIKRLNKAIGLKAVNSILVKVNQIGTLSETLAVIKRAKEAGFTVVVSHRSGETTDDFIADLAVGTGAEFVKFGAPARGERVVKYNRLLKIYQDLQLV